MSEQEKLAYLKALMYIALSDDKVDDDEIQYFDRIGTAYGLSVYQIKYRQNIIPKHMPSRYLSQPGSLHIFFFFDHFYFTQ